MLQKDEIKQLIDEFKPVLATKSDISELKDEIYKIRTDLSLEIRLNTEELARMVNAGFDNLHETIETGQNKYHPRRI